jgi:hypothetical protein
LVLEAPVEKLTRRVTPRTRETYTPRFRVEGESFFCGWERRSDQDPGGPRVILRAAVRT